MLTEGAVSEVGPDVSGCHARLWRDDAGAWWVEGCDSRHGTVLVNGLTARRRWWSRPAASAMAGKPLLCPWPRETNSASAASTTFLLIEGYPG